MGLEKRGIYAALLFLFIFIFGCVNSSAYMYDCKFMSISQCTGSWNNIVMKVSGTTNAHGEVYNGAGNYQYGICCNWTATIIERDCSLLNQANIIVNLSSSTNAHGAVKYDVTQYSTPICYGPLECENRGACDPPYYLDLLSLSGNTNAHLGDPDIYPNQKICCKHPSEPGETRTCAQKGGNTCNSPTTVCTPGHLITASDTPECCDIPCCTSSAQEACLNRDCGSWADSCGIEYNCGTCTNPNSECTGGGRCENPLYCTIDDNGVWDREYTWEGVNVKLQVYGTNVCNGEQVNLEVWKDNSFIVGDKHVTDIGGSDPDPVIFNSDGDANGSWMAEYHPSGSGLPNYYFKAITGAQTVNSRNLLTVNISQCANISRCNDYKTESSCTDNLCSGMVIDQGEIDSNPPIVCGLDGCNTKDSWNSCGCVWDNGACKFAADEIGCSNEPTCGDGTRESGETCDGTDSNGLNGLNGMDCTDFGFSGGTLGCSACEYNFSSCTGYSTSNCGNGIVDFGKEVCDRTGNNLTKKNGGNWNCTDFDEFGRGTLSCRSDCTFDTSQCIRAIDNFNYGTCIKDQTSVTNCDEGGGFYTSSWTGKYIWGHDGWASQLECSNTMNAPISSCYYDSVLLKWFYDPTQSRKSNCVGVSETTIECPAEIKLPFFGFYNLIITIAMIGAIYLILAIKKKKR
jgi:hypothetical protein